MRVLTFLFLFLISSGKNYSQHLSGEAKSQFNRNNLYVVLTGNTSFDNALKKAMTKYWVHKDVKGYISTDELKALISDKNNSFVYPKTFRNVYGTGTNTVWIEVAGILFLNGGKKDIGKYNLPYDALRIADFDYLGYEKGIEKASYRISLMIRTIAKDFYETPRPKDELVKWKQKTLLVNENHLNGKKKENVIQEAALKSYPYKYEIVPESKITTLIDAEDPNYLLLTPVASYWGKELVITDLTTGSEVFITRKGFSFSVRPKDIEAIVEKIR